MRESMQFYTFDAVSAPGWRQKRHQLTHSVKEEAKQSRRHEQVAIIDTPTMECEAFQLEARTFQ